MKSVITYTLNKCTKCLKCLRSCPTEAIRLNNHNRVVIIDDLCINCGKCIQSCSNQGLKCHGSTLADLENYKYRVALLPSCLFAASKNNQDVNRLVYAIKKLGFDYVMPMGEIEACVYKHSMNCAKAQDAIKVSSHCPVINGLIIKKYPTLIDNLTNEDYPSEVAARYIRNKFANHDNLGIFYLAECTAKLALAKFPYGNYQFEVDHALSISSLFPYINQLVSNLEIATQLCKEGLNGAISKSKDDKGYLNIDGLGKVSDALELCEFNLIQDIKYLNLNACFNGCCGGDLLWGNPYQGKNNIKELIKHSYTNQLNLSEQQILRIQPMTSESSKENIINKITRFELLNKQLEKLPEYDCGACGFPTCRMMAEEIIDNRKSIEDCRVLHPKRR